MADTRLKQADPAITREAFLSVSDTRLKALRKEQELARMAFVTAMKTLRATPVDSPEREFRRTQLRQTKAQYEARKLAVSQAQTVVDITLDSFRQAEEDRIAEATKTAAKENKVWAKTCKVARKPFEFAIPVKTVRIRKQSVGAVPAPCGVLCSDAFTADAHGRGCPECQRIAEEHELSFTQTPVVPIQEE